MKKINFLFLAISICIVQFTNANSSNKLTENQWDLKVVYSSNDGEKQTVLKLYADKEYELLVFAHKKNKAVEKRETGTYNKYGNLIIIHPKSKNKSFNTRFLILKKGKSLRELSAAITKKSSNVLSIDTCSKYFDASYIDSDFGEISNDRSLKKKIVDVDFNKIEREKILVSKKFSFDKTKYVPTDLQFKNMKAILIVGIDLGIDALKFLDEMKTTANYLKELGVDVKEFYIDKSIWSDIVKASEGAQILIYAGHGGNPNKANDGKLDFFVFDYTSMKGIVSELKLKKNALVIFNHACHSAGSSAGDTETLTEMQAIERVENYAEPFMKIGATAYYANSYFYSIPRFLNKLFLGHTLSQAYSEEAIDKIAKIKPNTYNENYQTGITSRAVNGTTFYHIEKGGKNSAPIHTNLTKKYSNAFVGNPNFTVMDFFK